MPTRLALQRALALHGARHLAKAEAACRRLLQAAPENPEALNHLGLLFYQRGDAVRALSFLRRAVRANPRSASCHLHLGLALEQSSDFEGALAAYRESDRLDPELSDATFNQGLMLLRLGRRRDDRHGRVPQKTSFSWSTTRDS